MPRYRLPNGKTVFSEKEIPENELEDFINEMMGSEEPVETVAPPITSEITESTIETPPVIDEPPPVTSEEPGMLRSFWEKANAPLLDIRGSLSPEMQQGMETFGQEHPIVGGGINMGVDFLSSMSSPISLMTGGAYGLAGKLPMIANLGKGLGTASALSGADTLLNAESSGEALTGAGEIGLGILGMRGPRPKTPDMIPEVRRPDEDPLFGIVEPTSVAEPRIQVTPEIGGFGTGRKEWPIGPDFELTSSGGRPLARVSPYEGTSKKLDLNPDGTVSITGSDVKFEVKGDDVFEVAKNGTKKIVKGNLRQEILTLPRTLQSSMDISAPFRQGIGLIHTGPWWKNWGAMVKSYGSEKAFQGVMDDIKSRPNYQMAQANKLAITDLTELTNREEAFMSTWAQKVPGVKPSARAYTAFLDKLRMDTFDNLITQAEKSGLDPKRNQVLVREIASYVNNATGRGNLGNWEKAAVNLNTVFFSPRLIASRLQMMNPKNYVFANPMVRKEYLKSVAAMASTWSLLAGAAKAGGAEVSLDPSSSEFGKIKIGDTRLDPGAGFQQYLVLFSRLAKGGYKEFQGEKYEEGEKKPGAAITDFIVNKLAPIPSYGARASGIGSSGFYPFSVGDESLRMFAPMMLQDLSELIQEDPSLVPAVGLSAIGFGEQTYGGRKDDSRLLGPLYPKKYDTTLRDRR